MLVFAGERVLLDGEAHADEGALADQLITRRNTQKLLHRDFPPTLDLLVFAAPEAESATVLRWTRAALAKLGDQGRAFAYAEIPRQIETRTLGTLDLPKACLVPLPLDRDAPARWGDLLAGLAGER